VRYRGPLRVGDTTLLERVELALHRDARVHLRGPNGAGKTTLIHALLRHLDLGDEHHLFLPQELDGERENQLRKELQKLTPTECGKVMNTAAALGLRPELALQSPAYSPGQLRKLLLARALSRQACLLILDEPTNHLDLPSVERLEFALREYRGALLVVTHDARFAEAAALDEHWDLQGGQLGVTRGGAER
jgi:ATPase subunit of ABC transporter with duplicated ATPase domains